jgi:hypothetical protein
MATINGLGLYHSGKIVYFNGRPVNKVEVTKRENGKVTFITDWPCAEITIPEDEFRKKFSEW